MHSEPGPAEADSRNKESMDALRRSLGIGPDSATSGVDERRLADESFVARVVLRSERPALLGSASSGSTPATVSSATGAIARTNGSGGGNSGGNEAMIRQRLTSMWHNVKYGRTAWSIGESTSSAAGNFSKNSAVWLLGQCYHRRNHGRDESSPDSDDSAMIRAFSLDFSTRLWMTYRKDIEEFRGAAGMTSDCGWGCMIRSGQMIVANTLLLQRLGRHWRWKRSAQAAGGDPMRTSGVMTAMEMQEEMEHRHIVRLFGDSYQSPLSIHNLCDLAKESLGKRPGDWFGPASTAHLLKDAAKKAASYNHVLRDICIYVAQDCTVYRQDVTDLCQGRALMRKKSDSAGASSRTSHSSPAASEDYSVVELPDDYDGVLVPTEGRNPQTGSRLFGGVIEGVPYFDEETEDPEIGQDVEVVEREPYSLNQQVNIDGEVWVAEGPATPTPSPAPSAPSQSMVEGAAGRVYPDLSTLHESTNGERQRRRHPKFNSAKSLASEDDWTPVLILVPVRLGGEKLNPVYVPCLRSLLATDSCVGVIGGRPRHSLYFIGFQDDNLIHLDPHLVQDGVNVLGAKSTTFALDSFHCKTPRKLNVNKMDPSCCLGFFCPTRRAFDGWCEVVKELAVPPGMPNYPIFTTVEGRSKEQQDVRRLSLLEDDAIGEEAKAANADGLAASEDFVFL